MNRGGLALIALVTACGDNAAPDELRQGGATTTFDRTSHAYLQPAANLDAAQRFRWQAGRSTFDFVWDVPKLGPLFNHLACVGCHTRNGRGHPQIGAAMGSEALVRVSLTEGEPGHPGGPVPVPGMGTQLQDHATVGLPEARVTQTWVMSTVSYGDGETIELREPRLDVRTPMGEPLGPNVRFSYRVGQPLIGLGLLDAISTADLEALADPSDTDGDGISGRLNMVWDPVTQATVPGRFGWKANEARLHTQVAAAFVNDLGLTSYVFLDSDGDRDITDEQLDDTQFFASTLGVPAAAERDVNASRGRELFRDFGCEGCHVSTFVTGPYPLAALAGQRIHPFTDLLLHDMGDGLTDARPDFLAEGVEWRTPSLWGIGLAQTVLVNATFLHDGRARTLAEAILWHGGEAMTAREAFRTAARSDREALLAFLGTL